MADVCTLQSKVTTAKISHLRQANNVVKRAKAELNQGLGLHYRKLKAPFRLACIQDSSAAGNVRHYAQEGVVALLCEDRLQGPSRDNEAELSDYQSNLLGGRAHIPWSHGAKAKRISYSTSHAETLAGIGGLEAGSLVAVRLAELHHVVGKPTVQNLLMAQEFGIKELPLDSCRDFYELCCGNKSVPQDKGQRLYIMAYREARICGRLRWTALIPTESMTADGLTKSLVSPPLMELLSAGMVKFKNEPNHPSLMRSLPLDRPAREEDFDMTDKELLQGVSTMTSAVACYVSKPMCYAALMLAMASPASAQGGLRPESRQKGRMKMKLAMLRPWSVPLQ